MFTGIITRLNILKLRSANFGKDLMRKPWSGDLISYQMEEQEQ